ncbi:MAG: hypothetical protein P9M07_01880 [Candidatus Aceula meridiana]|nr:hypothetical protein [Candidatus Aceula meridiana]
MMINIWHTIIWCIAEILEPFSFIGSFLANWLPTYFILGLLFLLLLISMFKRELGERRDCWLSSRIAKAKNELKGKAKSLPWYKKLLLNITQLYYPTASNFTLLILTMAVVFGIGNKCFWIPYEKAEFYRTLVPIQIGIVALIFPVMIFIIGFSGNKKASGVNLSEVLLRESFLFPAGIAGLFFLVNLIWARASYIVIVQIILSAFMYGCVLFRVIRLLLNDKRLLEKSKALLKDKLRRSIEKTIEERLGNNILLKELGENKTELQYSILDLEKSSEDYIKYDLKKRGIIVDINLANLDKIAKIIEEASRRNGFSFYKNVLDLSSDENQDIASLRSDGSQLQTFQEDKSRYLKKRFMDQVSDENPYVLSFRKRLLVEKSSLDEINDLIGKTFDVRRIDEEEDKLRTELRNLKDQFIDDIRNKRLGRVSSLREVYISLAELFLDIMKTYSSNYTMEMARKERGNIVGEWVEVQWLTDDLRDIYEVAMETHDRKIIREIGYLPIAIAHRAIKRLDHYIFEKSLGFLNLFYMFAIREKDKDLQFFMKDRCGVYIKETADYAIQYELDKIELGEDRIRQFKDFAIEIYLQLQQLLKQAYDAKDLEVFKKLISIGDKLFRHFRPSEDHPDADHLRWQLKLSDLSADEKARIEVQLKKKEFLESIEEEIQQKRNEMFFGLASFICDEYRNDKNKKDLLEYINFVGSALPSDLNKLTDIFLKCHDFDIEHFWGWEWWILPMDEEVHSIDFLGKIAFYYCIKALQISNTMQKQVLEKAKLSHNRDFVHMIEKNDSIIKKTISDLLDEVDQWGDLIPSIGEDKKKALFVAFDAAKDRQIKEQEDFLIDSNLNQVKINEFIKGFLKGYNENCAMHSLFQTLGQYEDQAQDTYKGPQKSMGFNRLDEKGVFVEGWHVHYSSWGEQYGSGIASSENNYFFEQLCAPLQAKQITSGDIINQIESTIKELKKRCVPNVIITSLNFDAQRLFFSNDSFIPHWHKDCPKKDIPNLHGVLKLKEGDIPVVRLFQKNNKGLIGIFDLKSFASLIQLRPVDDEDESKYFHGQFYIRIIDLSHDDKSRGEIITASPGWLNKYEDKERYLKTKVIVKTFERQELCIKDKSSGILLKVINDEQE